MAESSTPFRWPWGGFVAWTVFLAVLFPAASSGTEETEDVPRSRFYLHADWPDGITYEVRKATPSLREVGPLSYFEDVYLIGRIGARLDLDGAAFVADDSLSDFDDDVKVRRARFYVLGDFRFGLPLGYKFEFSVEGTDVLLNDFYLRWKPPRWVDSVDFGYLTPPMGLENVVNSRSLTFMETATPIQALAPGFRSGIAAAGHIARWRTAYKVGFFSAGQEQVTGDASNTSAQIVGRLAWVPWRESDEVEAGFVHLGLSLSYVFSGDSSIRYRARPESFIAPYVVDTDDTDAKNAFQSGVEAAWADGSLLLSGELLQSSVVVEEGGDHHFRGVYGLASWFLTGESHPYDGSTGLFGRVRPNRPFAFSGEGWGALEIGQRISWLDLSDGDVRGGEMLSVTSGITWHLNMELRLFANYVFAHVTDGPQDGDVSIFQARIEIGI